MARRLSLPHEHGGYLVVAGATVAAAVVAPHPLPAVGAGVAVAAGFFLRGPVDRIAAGRALAPWDRAALALLALVLAGGVALAGRGGARWALLTGAVALGIVAGSALLKRMRRQRETLVELCALGALGGSAALAAAAGGAPLIVAAVLGLVIGGHAVPSVPLVRAALRPAERKHQRRAVLVGAAVLAAAAAAVLALHPPAALAFVPRALHIAARAVRGVVPRPASQVGLAESVGLALVVALAVPLL